MRAHGWGPSEEVEEAGELVAAVVLQEQRVEELLQRLQMLPPHA